MSSTKVGKAGEPGAGPIPGPDTVPELEALIREARHRQRRRQVMIGLTVTALLGAAGGIAIAGHSPGLPRHASQPRPKLTEPASKPPVLNDPIPSSVGTAVLMWPVGYPAFGRDYGPPDYLDNLTTGRLSLHDNAPGFSAGDYQPYLVRAGRWLVYVGGGITMAIRDDLKGRPRALGRTPFFAAAASARRVWLERFSGGYLGVGTASVWQVSVPDGQRGPLITLPPRTLLVAGTDAGLLLEVPQGRGDFGLALWTPGGAPRTLPYAPSWGYGFDVSPGLVAYGTGCRALDTTASAYYATCRVLRVYDVVTGRLLSFQRPPGTAGWIPSEFDRVQAIAPGGQMIVAYAATRPLGQGRDRLFVMRMSGASSRPIPVPSSAARLYPKTAWSANGSWLFYQGPGGRLWAYQVSSGKVRQSRTPCCLYTVMVAFPSGRR